MLGCTVFLVNLQHAIVIGMDERLLAASIVLVLEAVAGCVPYRVVCYDTALRRAGVNVGDWVKYGNFSATWSSEMPITGFPSQFIRDLNSTDWMLVTVQTISTTNITYELKWHFNNGTDYTALDWIDVSSGVNPKGMSYHFPFFVSADLQVSDTLFNASSGKFTGYTINETIDREYLGVIAETHHTHVTKPPFHVGADYSYDFYWDTGGTLAEYNDYHVTIVPAFPTTKVHFEVIDSNPTWPIPEFPISALLLLFAIATLLAVACREKRARGIRVSS